MIRIISIVRCKFYYILNFSERIGAIKLLGCFGWKRDDVIQTIKSIYSDESEEYITKCFGAVALLQLKEWNETFMPFLLNYQNDSNNYIR